jgi:N-acetylmuramic acid 6-phosphate etherase
MASQSNTTPGDLSALTTEARNPASADIDRLSVIEIVRLMNREDAGVAAAVATQEAAIANAIEIIADRLRQGGRLVYIGAGTSGRLGVLDATECPPTFNTRPEQVVGLIAGGPPALVRAVEGAEDHPEAGAADLRSINLGAGDVVVGIATSGRTPYVIGGLDYARGIGATTIGLSCNRDAKLDAVADVKITPVVGPEVISGSTRLKAGTATKLVLNTITTGAMVRLGKTYGNLMVDLRATNTKLMHRSRRIVSMLTSLPEDAATDLLNRCGGEVKTAIVAHRQAVSPDIAREMLVRHGGHLRAALEVTEARSGGTGGLSARVASADDRTGSKLRVAPAGSVSSAGFGRGAEPPPTRYSNLVIGIDGGGSKTVAWVAERSNTDGRIIGRGSAGASNPQAVGFDIAGEAIAAAVVAAFADADLPPGQVGALCAALSGADRPQDREALVAWARRRNIAERIEFTNDAEPLIAAGTPDGWGIALICGTGSFCFGRAQDGRTVRCGGWGYLFGDEGSGYAIALAGLRAASRAADGRGPATKLLDRILRHLGLDEAPQLVREVYSRLAVDRPRLAQLAEVVFAAADTGDAVARELVASAARELAELIATVARQLGIDNTEFALALAGGVLLNWPRLADQVRTLLAAEGLRVSHVKAVADPVLGAVVMARRLS